jgi:hypothetical protein
MTVPVERPALDAIAIQRLPLPHASDRILRLLHFALLRFAAPLWRDSNFLAAAANAFTTARISAPVDSPSVLSVGKSKSISLPPAASCSSAARYFLGRPVILACSQSAKIFSTNEAVERRSLTAALSMAVLVGSEIHSGRKGYERSRIERAKYAIRPVGSISLKWDSPPGPTTFHW